MQPVSELLDGRAAERERMIVQQLRERGIVAPAVLDAIRRTPRELFVPPSSACDAYDDRALPIECGQTISQPYMVGLMTQLLELTGTERVLEVGTGSGYQTAILTRLALHVYTIDRHPLLTSLAAGRLAELGLHNVTLLAGDGSSGRPELAPFDAILVTAGGPRIPDALTDQLAQGGRLVMPIGPADEQVLARVRRTPDGLAHENLLRCRFVKLIGTGGWADS